MDDDRLYIDQGWVDALGLPREQIARMGLREFAERCFDRGIVPRVTVRESTMQPGLHLETVQDNDSVAL